MWGIMLRVENDGQITDTISLKTYPVTQLTVAQLKQQEQHMIALGQRMKAPHTYKKTWTQEKCTAERDMGIILATQQAARRFCMDGGWDSQKEAPVSHEKATQVTMYHVAGGIKSAVFQNLMLDFVNVSIRAPIESMAQDGGKHDPRFKFNMQLINCACTELTDYFMNEMTNEITRRNNQIWGSSLTAFSSGDVPLPTICAPRLPTDLKRSAWDFIKYPTQAPDNIETIIFNDPVVLVARHDDHNPFFQISNALNAWIMLKALNWSLTSTYVIHLDAGYPSPIDELHQGLLAPYHKLIDGATLMGKRVHFRGNVLVASAETSGPMMQHLNDDEPCYDSDLIKLFRAQSLLTMNVTPEVELEVGLNRIGPMIVTVITRRPYRGRKLERIWVNENEVMERMRTEYKDLNVEFRSVDYVGLTLREQMITTIESDIIIGMHGAGLVNVLWARPMTTVMEIFPFLRRRWGYRNLCQFVGCDWHDYRGGEDIGNKRHPNRQNKRILYDDWMLFFQPLFERTYEAFQTQQAVLRAKA
ncbi:unnamed protein product [Peronospora belbahrii]|uniref:Glycosyltransferase 61 catalytic domain-containing protein n=1 Tax=Peronospora belbahrii TaxID=622444 RepID=A0AAU9KW48_9STRA|nr:unnamed protein product [Peronospora belbahrii]